MKIINISFPLAGIEPTSNRIYSHTLVSLSRNWLSIYNINKKVPQIEHMRNYSMSKTAKNSQGLGRLHTVRKKTTKDYIEHCILEQNIIIYVFLFPCKIFFFLPYNPLCVFSIQRDVGKVICAQLKP